MPRNFYHSHLADLFSAEIDRAWRNTPGVKPNAGSEPNHIARFIQGTPAGIAAAIKAIPGVTAVAVQGSFCHASPYAFWKSGQEYPKRELADLLVVVEIVVPGVKKLSRALLVQAKMGSTGLPSWVPPQQLTGLNERQRELYANLPEFCLEIAGRPTHGQFKKSGLSAGQYMSSLGKDLYYDLQGLQPIYPAGLVYVGIDRDRGRPGMPLTPWLAENGRPQTVSAVATVAISFGEALADLVTEPNSRFGVQCDPTLAPKDWCRLIDHLKRWAADRDREGHKTNHGVNLRAGTTTSGIFHNIQTFQTHHGQLLNLMQWQHLADSDWKGSIGPVSMTSIHGTWPPQRQIKALASDPGEPRIEWPREIESEDPGGFGMLKIRIHRDWNSNLDLAADGRFVVI